MIEGARYANVMLWLSAYLVANSNKIFKYKLAKMTFFDF